MNFLKPSLNLLIFSFYGSIHFLLDSTWTWLMIKLVASANKHLGFISLSVTTESPACSSDNHLMRITCVQVFKCPWSRWASCSFVNRMPSCKLSVVLLTIFLVSSCFLQSENVHRRQWTLRTDFLFCGEKSLVFSRRLNFMDGTSGNRTAAAEERLYLQAAWIKFDQRAGCSCGGRMGRMFVKHERPSKYFRLSHRRVRFKLW